MEEDVGEEERKEVGSVLNASANDIPTHFPGPAASRSPRSPRPRKHRRPGTPGSQPTTASLITMAQKI